MSELEKAGFTVTEINMDFHYALKVVKGFLSGYSHLVEFDGEFWQPITMSRPDNQQLYYICLQFKNRGHLPLPIFDDLKNSDIGIAQKAVIRVMNVLSFWQARNARADINDAYSGIFNDGRSSFTIYSMVKNIVRYYA